MHGLRERTTVQTSNGVEVREENGQPSRACVPPCPGPPSATSVARVFTFMVGESCCLPVSQFGRMDAFRRVSRHLLPTPMQHVSPVQPMRCCSPDIFRTRSVGGDWERRVDEK
ncbi:unnamed protein product [Ectocarpus sp. 6 AP-2014]